MAGAKEVILDQLRSGQYVYEKLTAELSDAEYFKPPVEGGNHVAWLLGHVACSEDSIVSQITGGPKRIPEATHELFKGGSTCLADPKKYPSRKQIDELFLNSRAHTVEAITKYDERKWGDSSPWGSKSPFPTMGSMWGLQGTHQFWHIGQLAVCRQAMKKKPALF